MLLSISIWLAPPCPGQEHRRLSVGLCWSAIARIVPEVLMECQCISVETVQGHGAYAGWQQPLLAAA